MGNCSLNVTRSSLVFAYSSFLALTKCQQMRMKVIQSGLFGAKAPQCEDDGSFKQIQFWEGYQWCVDADGIELLGTRVGPGEKKPDCSRGNSSCVLYSKGLKICYASFFAIFLEQLNDKMSSHKRNLVSSVINESRL